jgi:transcriptional regulator with XRE-family HTH domain
MGKRYQSVADMVRDTSEPEFAARFKEQQEEFSISRHLFLMRNKAGLTQAQLALKIGCQQNRISRLEKTPNAKIRLGDLQDYVTAMGVGIGIHMGQKRSAVDTIKCAAFEIKRQLDKLAGLAQGDEKISAEVRSFSEEYLFNTLRLFGGSRKQLESPSVGERNPVEVPMELFAETLAVVERSGGLLPQGVEEGGVYVCADDAVEEEPAKVAAVA